MKGVIASLMLVAVAQPAYGQASDGARMLGRLATTLLGGSPSQQPRLPTYNIGQFEIAGVKLGMTYEEAGTAIVEAGYPKSWEDTFVDSFEQKVLDAAARREGAQSSRERDQVLGGTIRSSLASGEVLSVRFTPTPSGTRVSEVTVTISQQRMDSDVFEKLVAEKYGTPSYRHSGQLEQGWCTSNEQKCDGISSPHDRKLTSRTFVQNTLTLAEGSTFFSDLAAAHQNELDRRAPKATTAVF